MFQSNHALPLTGLINGRHAGVLTCLQDDWSSSNEQLQIARDAARASMDHIGPEEWEDRFGNEPRKGADILVQCLEREGAYRYSLLLKLSQGPLHPAGCHAPTCLPWKRCDLLRSVQHEGPHRCQVGMGQRKPDMQCLSPRRGTPFW